MHVVTFYSYKGGVGRTLSLVNVAFELAARGKRVLVVDFDLEAPGIPSYEVFPRIRQTPGIVDYVTAYLSSGIAPDVRDYIAESAEQNLWVMPAGKADANYGVRLSAIDWQTLYSKNDGYLLFEDMRSQWKTVLNADYVLIDSRTGHSDIGGICTRQLPDVVVACFFPNMQNIYGMSSVVKTIVSEANRGGRTIDLLPVPSRVPALDDEHGILARNLAVAEQEIGYTLPSATIHHYDSIALVSDAIFVKDRGGSRLAKEYKDLANAIVQSNIRDSDGALAFLEGLRDRFFTEQGVAVSDVMMQKLEDISLIHAESGRVLEAVADIRFLLMQHESVHLLLSAALDTGYRKSSVLRKRAAALQSLGRSDDAISDLQGILSIDAPDVSDVIYAVRILSLEAPHTLVNQVPRIAERLTVAERIKIASMLTGSRDTLDLAEHILVSSLTEVKDVELRNSATRDLMLVLIGAGKFEKAVTLSDKVEPAARGIAWYFNRAMALWGVEGFPDRDAFQIVLALAGSHEGNDANFSLCLALAYAIIGDTEHARLCLSKAQNAIRLTAVPTFSPWRYLTVRPSDFRSDIAAVRQFVDVEEYIEKPAPLFLRQEKRLIH